MRLMTIMQYVVIHHIVSEGKPVSSGDFRRHFAECGRNETPAFIGNLLQNMEKSGLLKKKEGTADAAKRERRNPNYWTPTKEGLEVYKTWRRLLVKKKSAEKA